MICELEDKIFTTEDTEFEGLALAVFQFQYKNNPLYRQYIDLLSLNPSLVTSINKIPFLPIEFFKTRRVATTDFSEEATFESSGTTQTTPSRHFIKDLSLYQRSFERSFQNVYGRVSDWCILGLLPAYLERANSSLVFMVNQLITQSRNEHSGFYLYEFEKLSQVLQQLREIGQKTLLIGVTFALLDFATYFPQPLKNAIVIETGGMKGRRKEVTRHEVHEILKNAFGIPAIHSEYGMTELLSQAYSQGEGIFRCPNWMKILLREEDDPGVIKSTGRGLINVIDLANIYSCSFIATDDIGILDMDGRFEVLGRRDNSDLRGCSLMAAENSWF
jgi:phenylacetate-coenzyme A ligase PaaK-like adenylate-forming protein